MGADPLGEETGRSGSPLTVRAFFGLPLPDDQRAAYARAVDVATSLAPRWRWTRAENLHVTIRFLGHLELERAERIAERVEAKRPHAFAVQLGGVDAFKRGKLASVLWAGLELGVEDVTRLAQLVDAECAREGLEQEKRVYRPHMTLARARERTGAPIPRVDPPALPPWRVEELVLYQSRLRPTGPVYEPLRVIPLR
jgi:2'-5' RNA ligase